MKDSLTIRNTIQKQVSSGLLDAVESMDLQTSVSRGPFRSQCKSDLTEPNWIQRLSQFNVS